MILRTATKINYIIIRLSDTSIARVYYTTIADHPFYEYNYEFKTEYFLVSKRIGEKTVSITLSATLTNNQLYKVIKAVQSIINEVQESFGAA